MREDYRPWLAAGATVVSVGAAVSGTVSVPVSLICAAGLPLVILRAHRWPTRVATLVGAAFLLLLADLAFATHGHDLRYALVDALLAVAGLHAARLQTDRDHLVALGIQLAIMACALSQLGVNSATELGAPLWVALWLGVSLPQLRGVVDARPQRVVAGPPGRERRTVQVSAIVAVATAAVLALVFLPSQAPRAARSFGGGGGGFDSSGAASPGAGSDGGAARVGLSSSGQMDLRTRGSTSDRLVLYVSGPSALWRAGVFDHYDGTSFTRTPTEETPLIETDTGTTANAQVPVDAGDVSDVTRISVNLVAGQDTILSIGQPLRVSADVPVTEDQLGNLGTTEFRDTYETYGGTPGPDAQAAAAPTRNDLWLQLPAELPQRVRDLARTWTAGTTGPAAAIEAIETHLHTDGFTYSLDSPVPAKGEDAVDDVLFNSRQGFCEQYAATTTVLMRALGFPARVVDGYAYGTPSTGPYGEIQEVRDSDAHAWVEYWAPGRGWITADPTAGIPQAAPSPSVLHRVPLWVWILLGGLLVLGALAFGLRRRIAGLLRRGGPASSVDGPEPVVLQPVTAAFTRLVSALSDTGSPRRPEETPADVLLRVPGGWALRREILPALERELWGPDSPDPAAAARAADVLDQLTAEVVEAAAAITV